MFRAFRLVIPAAVAVMVASSGVASAKTTSPTAATTQTAKPAMHKAHAKGSAAVKKIQTALNKNGANLKVDGLMGPSTRAAIKSFQAGHGLKATGKLDKATKAKLLG